MSEPENHTLRLLIEFRNEFREFKSETGKSFADIREHFEHFDDRFERVDTRLETITRALGNEIAQAKFVTGGIDQRFAEIERRLSALEQRQ
jgi:hypothetical protein